MVDFSRNTVSNFIMPSFFTELQVTVVLKLLIHLLLPRIIFSTLCMYNYSMYLKPHDLGKKTTISSGLEQFPQGILFFFYFDDRNIISRKLITFAASKRLHSAVSGRGRCT